MYRFTYFLDIKILFSFQDEDMMNYQEHETGDNQSGRAEELQKVLLVSYDI